MSIPAFQGLLPPLFQMDHGLRTTRGSVFSSASRLSLCSAEYNVLFFNTQWMIASSPIRRRRCYPPLNVRYNPHCRDLAFFSWNYQTSTSFVVFTVKSQDDHFLPSLERVSPPDSQAASSLFLTYLFSSDTWSSYRCHMFCAIMSYPHVEVRTQALTTESPPAICHILHGYSIYPIRPDDCTIVHGIHLLIIDVFLRLISPIIFVSSLAEHPES